MDHLTGNAGYEPTLLRQLIVERHWQKFPTFEAKFRRAAQKFAEQEDEPELRKVTVSSRQFERWYSGKVKTEPHPDATRILEYMFGYPVKDLLAPARQSRQARVPDVGDQCAGSSVSTGLAGDTVGVPCSGELAEQLFRAPDLTEIDDMKRRELLRIMTVAGTLLAISPVRDIDWDRFGYFADPSGKPDGQGLEDHAALISHLWQVFVLSRTKSVVFPLVLDQLDVLTNSLERPAGPEMYRRLCGLASSVLQLAGEIMFDGNKYTDAAYCYTLAATAGKEADMPDLWACALTRHAFIGVYERKFDKSLPMLELAGALALRGNNALSTRHWVAAVRAQAFAGLGDLSACQRELDAAEHVHDLRGDFQNGGWLRFDGSRLAEERGTCYVQLGRPDLAESALHDALSMNLTVRRRGGLMTDLAMLGAQRRDPDQIIKYADAAVDLVLQTGSGVIVRKLSALRPHLAPFLDSTEVRDLDGRISALSERP